MKNLINYIKDKIYYIMAATVIIIILLIIISSCSNNSGNTYESIENNMVEAARKYYSSRKNKLPKEESSTVQLSVGTLIDAELLKEIKDPKDKTNICEGYVQIKKVDDDYSYIPFLTCKGNYEPKYLTDIIKDSKLDEYGNGVYEIDGEYVYRGDDVNNYVTFNNQLWRIVKVDKDGDIKLVLAKRTNESYAWDSSYNNEKKISVGITTDYLHTNIRKALNELYDENFIPKKKSDKDYRGYIVSKNLCVGYVSLTDEFNVEKECSVIKENEKIGLLNTTDYKNASLSNYCLKLEDEACINSNYLSDTNNFNTWVLNASAENSYTATYLYGVLKNKNANGIMRLNPVIYITSNAVILSGKGTVENPYIVK